jgi:AcrR family transcriptional regulator
MTGSNPIQFSVMDSARMDPPPQSVKTRRYDASRRRAEAARTRDRVLDVAERLFLERGYAATTVGAVAENAGVSTELVYKTLGGKAGLVREIQRRGLLGAGPIPAETRSDALAATDIDARTLLREWSRLTIEVSPRTAPILLLVRAAAAGDADLAAVQADMTAAHLERMALNARRLLAHPGVRPGLTPDRVRDVLWTYTAPELYDRLVVHQGWSLEDYADFVFRGMSGQLLADG